MKCKMDFFSSISRLILLALTFSCNADPSHEETPVFVANAAYESIVITYNDILCIYEGDSISYIPSTDEYSTTFGLPGSHKNDARKERLIKLKYNDGSVQKTDTPPVYLKLTTDNLGRNWEGIEQLSDKTFLIITDYFPETIFGYLCME